MNMNTDQLIDILSKDTLVQKLPSTGLYALLAALVLLAYTLYLYASSGMGIRPNYGFHIQDGIVMLKQVLPLLLTVMMYPLMRASLYPEARTRQYLLPIALYGAVMAGLFAWAWMDTAPEARAMSFWGKSYLKCIITIPLYSWIAMAVIFFPMRRFAPNNEKATAFMAAVIAGGIATTVYAFSCTEDSPLFYAFWYNFSLFSAVALGAWIGARFLRW